MDENIKQILEKFPFLSYGELGDDRYLGIIQNSDNQLISIYVLDMIPTEQLRKYFLECGEEWWWGSNRSIPINIFLKDRFKIFKPYVKHFSNKDFELLAGPSVSLAETIARRVRKRQVTLLRK